MNKTDILEYYDQSVTEVAMCYSAIKSKFTDDYVDALMRTRGYFSEHQRKMIEDLELGFASINHSEDKDIYINGFYGVNPINFANNIAGNAPNAVKESFLVTKNGNFLLDNRFIIPVEDLAGNYVALIGYYPDQRKYITAATPFFSKEALFFNYRKAYEMAWKETNGVVCLVEGIFDSLSMTSIGIPCMATMGATVSVAKGELLKHFNKVIGIPDADKVGRASLDRNAPKGWKVPNNTTMLEIKANPIPLANGETIKVKDMDNFVSWFNPEDVRESILQFSTSTNNIEVLEI